MIHTKIYCNMNNLNFDNINIEYDFTFEGRKFFHHDNPNLIF
jgi:hypothetical protein